jgi:hypothetical protein
MIARAMRRALALLLLSPIAAQTETPEQQLEAKLASPFLKRAPWTTDYDEARRRARDADELIFGYFTTAGY